MTHTHHSHPERGSREAFGPHDFGSRPRRRRDAFPPMPDGGWFPGDGPSGRGAGGRGGRGGPGFDGPGFDGPGFGGPGGRGPGGRGGPEGGRAPGPSGLGFGGPGPGGPGFGGPGFDGPGFGGGPRGRGFGPGFGPGGHRGRGPRGGRAGRGDVRAAILLLLADQPMHGYQIIQEIAERSGGIWRPSPGAVYPALNLLQDEGLVEISSDGGRRLATLTDAGRTYVTERGEELGDPWQDAAGRGHRRHQELRAALEAVAAALHQVARTGTDQQVDAAAGILERARRELYLVLAGPVEDAPVEDAAVDEAPVDEAPVDDAPVDDGPADGDAVR